VDSRITVTPVTPEEGEPAADAAHELSALLRRDASGWRVARPALIVFLAVLLAGAAAGALAHAVTGGYQSWPTTVVKTATGWRVGGIDGLQQSGEELAGRYLVWNNGGCLELLDTRGGKTTVLWLPTDDNGSPTACVSTAYVAWTVEKHPGDFDHLQISAYDLRRRRSFVVPGTSDCDGTTPALSGDTLFWEGDVVPDPTGSRRVIHGLDLAGGRRFVVASGVVSLLAAGDGLAMWSTEDKTAKTTLTMVKDLDTGRLWRLRLCTRPGYVADLRLLTGRTVVWQDDRSSGDMRDSVIETLDLDSGRHRVVAKAKGDVDLLCAGGGRLAWMARGGRVLLQNAGGGACVAAPDLGAISDTTMAWETGDNGDHVETARLAR
jgi:hypothetical protein